METNNATPNPTQEVKPLSGFLGQIVDLLKKVVEALSNPTKDEKPVN
jgi:hypothetical protein